MAKLWLINSRVFNIMEHNILLNCWQWIVIHFSAMCDDQTMNTRQQQQQQQNSFNKFTLEAIHLKKNWRAFCVCDTHFALRASIFPKRLFILFMCKMCKRLTSSFFFYELFFFFVFTLPNENNKFTIGDAVTTIFSL